MENIFYLLGLVATIIIGLIGFSTSFILLSKRTKSILALVIYSLVVNLSLLISFSYIFEIIFKNNVSMTRITVISSVTIVLLLIVLNFSLFKQLPGPIIDKIIPVGTEYMTLDSGSRIAYWYFEGQGAVNETPILFIHGGAGAYTRNLDREFFKSFTEEGYDVYLYDQPGGGFSDYMSLDEYSMDRYILDIECIRKIIGAEKVILVGQSFGALICSAYAVEHTENIESIIFTSPGELRPNSIIERNMDKKEIKEKGIVYASESLYKFKPSINEAIRFAAVVLMCKFGSAETAEQLVSQKEMTEFLTRSIPEAIGKSYHIKYIDQVPQLTGGGINVHVNMVMQNEYKKISQSIISKLYDIDVPVLILRAEYDYVKWEATKLYREIFTNSYLVYISESGHIPWSINIDDTYHSMLNFMNGNVELLVNYEGKTDPRMMN